MIILWHSYGILIAFLCCFYKALTGKWSFQIWIKIKFADSNTPIDWLDSIGIIPSDSRSSTRSNLKFESNWFAQFFSVHLNGSPSVNQTAWFTVQCIQHTEMHWKLRTRACKIQFNGKKFEFGAPCLSREIGSALRTGSIDCRIGKAAERRTKKFISKQR